MSDSPTLEDILEIQRHFGLPSPALVEKDWYVVRALSAISEADTGDCRLVFGGGTALSRAHGLLRRMSEDIDLKIVADAPPSRTALRRIRENITAKLIDAGFGFDPANPAHRKSNFENRYTLYRLPYAPMAAGEGALRPEIKIETSAWPLRRPATGKPVRSFIAEGFRHLLLHLFAGDAGALLLPEFCPRWRAVWARHAVALVVCALHSFMAEAAFEIAGDLLMFAVVVAVADGFHLADIDARPHDMQMLAPQLFVHDDDAGVPLETELFFKCVDRFKPLFR